LQLCQKENEDQLEKEGWPLIQRAKHRSSGLASFAKKVGVHGHFALKNEQASPHFFM